MEIQRRRVQRLIKEVVLPLLYPETAPLDIAAHFVRGEPIAPAEAYAREFQPFSIGQHWGGAWSTAWFRFSGTVPSRWAGEHVVARLGLGYRGMVGFGGEGLLWDGESPVQGINPRHNETAVASPAKGGEAVELHLEAAANPYVPWGGMEWPLLLPDYEGAPLYRLDRAELAVSDRELGSAWTDLRVLTELADELGPGDARSIEIIRALDRVALAVDTSDVRASLLSQHGAWQGLLDSRSPQRAHVVTAVGHAHIDSAWLWPIRETRRKCARTFATAVRLMDDEPDYVFVCSQAQQHAWMEEDYPKLFDAMKEKVASGQFEPVGSMWVEPDTNLPSGESLVRQLVFGKRFFMKHYGIETEDCWLPDAFGYSANLPQILRAAGVRFFLTQKLSWNETDRFPHHTFWWEGIDGSRVLAHCPPTDTYNGEFRVSELARGQRDFAQHGISGHSLYVYGYGDGGGGPSQAMLDSYKRLRDLDPLPKVKLGTAASFFRAVEAEAVEAETALTEARPGTVATAHAPGVGGLPVWVGELYLERHRAVQTTQAHIKLGNRRSEDLLREAEMWSVVGLATDYPAAELDDAWRLVLLHQFHDMLPGSSIHWVHQDSQAAYARVKAIAGDIIERACGAIAGRVGGGTPSAGVVVFNAGSHARADLVELDPSSAGLLAVELSTTGEAGGFVALTAGADDGPRVPVQTLADGNLGFIASVPGCGWAGYHLAPAAAGDTPTQAAAPAVAGRDGTGFELSNGLLSVRIDDDGTLSSVIDHTTGRQIIAHDMQGNVFQLHHDLPNDTDAWDVDQGTFDRASEIRRAESIEIVEEGPVRAAVRVVHSFGSSHISQDIRLAMGSKRLEFATNVEWAERHRFLKVAFPLAIRAPSASYEVQFGYVERPTHANTTWDAARFEVPAQRWADLSEPGCGAALLNDCKYGYDIRGSVMRLSLLRGPTWPDPEADKGSHRFSYALLPHGGLASSLNGPASVVDEAEAFNLHLRGVFVTGASGATVAPLPAHSSVVDVAGAMVSSVKRSDAGEDLIVRIFEPAGSHGHAHLTFGEGGIGRLTAAARTDVLERHLDAVELSPDGGLDLTLHPFELITLSLTSASAGPAAAGATTGGATAASTGAASTGAAGMTTAGTTTAGMTTAGPAAAGAPTGGATAASTGAAGMTGAGMTAAGMTTAGTTTAGTTTAGTTTGGATAANTGAAGTTTAGTTTAGTTTAGTTPDGTNPPATPADRTQSRSGRSSETESPSTTKDE
jgi:alpha-mannosidase